MHCSYDRLTTEAVVSSEDAVEVEEGNQDLGRAATNTLVASNNTRYYMNWQCMTQNTFILPILIEAYELQFVASL